MNQNELTSMPGKTVYIRGGAHFCCAAANDRLLLLQFAARDEPLFKKGAPVQYIVARHPRWMDGALVWAQGDYFPIVPSLDGPDASGKALRAAANALMND